MNTKHSRIAFIIIISILILSCDKQEEVCKCDVNIKIVDGAVGVLSTYTIIGVPDACNNFNFLEFREEQNLPDNHWFSNVSNCR